MTTNAELTKKLIALAEEYDDLMHSANYKAKMINNDCDAMEHDKLCSFADQTLDVILDELKKYEFNGNDCLYNDHKCCSKKIIGDTIVKAILDLND